MSDYKIQVNDNTDELVELFKALGCKYFNHTCSTRNYMLFENGMVFFCKLKSNFKASKAKEVTIEELRDLVVLKRNDVNDATHECMGDKFLVQGHRRYEWTFGGWATSGIAVSKLKPIQEKQMTSHNIEQQALKANPKLFLDPAQNHVEIEWDGSFMKQAHWVEVPEWANYAYDNDQGICFLKDEVGFNHPLLLWQRTQDEPFLTPESVVKREVNSKNVVQKANEFSERLKKLEYQFEVTGSSASGSINLMPRNSSESIGIHGTIEPKPDLSTQDEQILSNEQQRLLIEYPHYYKDVRHLAVVDVYEVLDLFGVTDQAVGHTVKKLLVTGKRGAKGQLQDLIEARDTLNRAIEIQERKANETK